MIRLKIKKKLHLIILTIIIILLSLIPTIQTIIKTGKEWHGVPPEYVSDSLYYYAQVNQVSEGYPFIGNPYFIEHRNAISPAFFVPDWLYAIPLFFGISLTTTIIFNFVFWSLIFAFLSFAILRTLTLSRWAATIGSIFIYLQAYWLILRPVSRQEVFPFFLFFLLALILWLKEPSKKKNSIILSLATATPFYIYAYLWQIVVVVNVLIVFFLFIKKRKADTNRFIITNVFALLLAIPELILLVTQFFTPFYWDTMKRIGLAETHIPPLYSIYYIRWISIIMLIGILLYFFLKKKNEEEIDKIKEINLFFFLTGGGLFIVLISNIITGKELETATHVGSFVMLWFAFCFTVYGFIIIKKWILFQNLTFIKKGTLIVLFLVCAFGLMKNFSISLPFIYISNDNTINNIQQYAVPLQWLSKKESAPVVIWADGLLSHYIPILTKNYVLFAAAGGLQVESSQEVEERYLVSKYFNNLSIADLKKNYRVYAGAGNADDIPQAYNRTIRICNFLQLYRFDFSCGTKVTGISLKGQNYFINLYNEYKNIQLNISTELKKFKVMYIIKDKINDPQFHPENIKGSTLVYKDNRFLIYKIY